MSRRIEQGVIIKGAFFGVKVSIIHAASHAALIDISSIIYKKEKVIAKNSINLRSFHHINFKT